MSARAASPQATLSLARRKLEQTAQALREAGPRIRTTPRAGWIAAIREALGMSVQDLADRLSITRAAAGKLEGNEQRRSIQLDSLQRAADALGCDLVYALVPRKPLQEVVDARRLEIFKAMHARTQHHMRLEAQDSSPSEDDRQLLRQAELAVPDRMLWRKDG